MNENPSAHRSEQVAAFLAGSAGSKHHDSKRPLQDCERSGSIPCG
jgi:hypothetical protein